MICLLAVAPMWRTVFRVAAAPWTPGLVPGPAWTPRPVPGPVWYCTPASAVSPSCIARTQTSNCPPMRAPATPPPPATCELLLYTTRVHLLSLLLLSPLSSLFSSSPPPLSPPLPSSPISSALSPPLLSSPLLSFLLSSFSIQVCTSVSHSSVCLPVRPSVCLSVPLSVQVRRGHDSDSICPGQSILLPPTRPQDQPPPLTTTNTVCLSSVCLSVCLSVWLAVWLAVGPGQPEDCEE